MDIETQLHEKWLIFWWSLGVGISVLGLAWKNGYFINDSPPSFLRISGKDVLRGFALFIFAEVFFIPFLAGVTLFAWRGDITLTPQVKGWLNIAMMVSGFVSALLAYYLLQPGQKKLLWGEGPASWKRNLGLGVTAWFIFFPLILAINQLISIAVWHLFHQPFAEQGVVMSLREVKEYPILFGMMALSIVTLIPLTEEFLFRGLLQTWLKNKYGTSPSIAIASIVFAAFHFTVDQGLTNIELLSTLFLFSCILGYLFERQRSLWAPIGLHSFINFMGLLLIFNE